MKILIATGIYPPDIGGPAEYAKNLVDDFLVRGFNVKVLFYKFEKKLPSVIRHCFYFFRVILNIYKTDLIIALDTFSVGLPAVLVAKILRKKIIIRTGGDFLWEQYITRTGDSVLLRDFYQTSRKNWSLKEKIIFKLTRWTLNNSSALVFSTEWQRDIWLTPYEFDLKKCYLIENFYGEKSINFEPKKKNFVFAGRLITLKNIDILKDAFNEALKIDSEIKLEIVSGLSCENLMKKIQSCYATILPSLSDVSPNFILDSIRINKPFILTEESGLYNKLKNIGIFVNPLDKIDIKNKILFLADQNNYDEYKKRIANFNFTHSWHKISEEFLSIYKNIL
ncbi:hypothetical protein KJ671_00210 [Patescibacteria group bacterium]|nr:hypothetical protein [Patescibacteria group bacterium]